MCATPTLQGAGAATWSPEAIYDQALTMPSAPHVTSSASGSAFRLVLVLVAKRGGDRSCCASICALCEAARLLFCPPFAIRQLRDRMARSSPCSFSCHVARQR